MPGLPPRRSCALPSLALTLALLGLAAGCQRGAVSPRLLLLITVDTLRADRLGGYGSPLRLTPNLDSLATRSLVFTSAWAPASLTLPSVSAILTGRHPAQIGMLDNASVLAPHVPTLASALSAGGWRCGAVVSNFVLRRASGLSAGFQRFDDKLPQKEASARLRERTARDTTDAMLRVAEQCSAEDGWRCFLWVHYQDPHGPYTPPDGLRERYLAAERAEPDGRRELMTLPGREGRGGIPEYQRIGDRREIGFYRAGYDGEIRHVDVEIGRLLDALEARGMLEEAAIVFAADHGEALGEDDRWFSHGLSLDDPLVRVPLMIAGPGVEAGRRDDVVALVDLFPTLLRWVAGGAAALPTSGRDLLADGAAAASSRVPLSNGAVGDLRRSGWVEAGWVFERSAADGLRWRRDGRAVSPDEVPRDLAARLPAALDSYEASLLGGGLPPARRDPGPGEREQLRALGYAE